MAFTPDGMFYLSKEDYAPTVGLAGQGIRGMLGVQNEEEKLAQQKLDVDAIVKGSDLSTKEGQAVALAKIQAVSPDAWMVFKKELEGMDLDRMKGEAYAQQVELQNKTLEIKQEEQAAQKRVPKLGNWWDINEKRGAIQYFLQTTQDAENLEGIDWSKMNEAKAKALLRKIHKGGSNQQIKSMQEDLTAKRNTHIVNNKYNPDAVTSDTVLKPAANLFSGEAASDKPNLGGTQLPVTPAPAWQQGKGFWDDVKRQDTDTALPSDEIY